METSAERDEKCSWARKGTWLRRNKARVVAGEAAVNVKEICALALEGFERCLRARPPRGTAPGHLSESSFEIFKRETHQASCLPRFRQAGAQRQLYLWLILATLPPKLAADLNGCYTRSIAFLVRQEVKRDERLVASNPDVLHTAVVLVSLREVPEGPVCQAGKRKPKF